MRLLAFVVTGALLAGCATPERSPGPTKEELEEAAKPPEVSCPKPQLPAEVVQAHLSGTTRVRIEANAKGAVTKAEVAQSSGSTPAHASADEAVVKAIRQCRFPVLNGDSTRDGEIPVSW